MRFRYSVTEPSQDESDSLPRLPFLLRAGERQARVVGLVDSGATVNVLPYEVGLSLGASWDDARAIIRLSGNLGNLPAKPFFAEAQIATFPPVRLAFAWVQSPAAPLILGQTNFFMLFDVCFYRADLEFDVTPRS